MSVPRNLSLNPLSKHFTHFVAYTATASMQLKKQTHAINTQYHITERTQGPQSFFLSLDLRFLVFCCCCQCDYDDFVGYGDDVLTMMIILLRKWGQHKRNTAQLFTFSLS